MVQAYLLVCCAVGNIFVIIVAESKLFPTQTIEFLFFAGVLRVFLSLNEVRAWELLATCLRLNADLSDPAAIKF